jgi:Cu(I)/Ag(I) efflux system membrane fusion protein
VQVEVPEAAVLALRESAPVEVRLPLLEGKTLVGRIDAIGDAAPERGGLFPLLVRLDSDHGVRPGMTAELTVTTQQSQVKRVPITAIVDPSGERPSVFVVESGKVRQVPVRLGRVDGQTVVVKGELSAGERVVVGGHQYLLDGDAVDVRS